LDVGRFARLSADDLLCGCVERVTHKGRLRGGKIDIGAILPTPSAAGRLEDLGGLLDECALLVRREFHHASVFVGHTKRRENLSGNAEIGVIHMRRLDGLWNFQRHLSKLVDSHFTRSQGVYRFLWPTISPLRVRRSTRVRFFSIAGVSNEMCGISQRYSAMNQIGLSVIIQFK